MISDIDVIQQRSEKKDTIYISACIGISSQYYCFTRQYGAYSKGTFNSNITFQNIPLGDTQTAVFAYLIINAGHGSPHDIQYKLSNATLQLVQTGVNSLKSNTTQTIISILERVIGATFRAIVGTVINFVEGLVNLFTQGCDGWLAAGVHGFTGQDVCSGNPSGNVTTRGVDPSSGTEDEKLFGFIPGVVCNIHQSEYEVKWSVEVSDGLGNRTVPGSGFSQGSRLKLSIVPWLTCLLCVLYFL